MPKVASREVNRESRDATFGASQKIVHDYDKNPGEANAALCQMMQHGKSEVNV